jgi:ABC-type uncharacterized transport system involved in gliding motility auxiliary subunit
VALMSNKTQSRNYSFIALIVAGLAVIAAILLGITRGLVGMQVFTVAKVDNLNRAILVSLGVIILGLAIYAFLEPDRVRRALTGRQARYGSNAFIMSLAFLGILIVSNVLAFQNPVNVADLTQDKTNTLSPQLLKAVKQLPAKVTATGFFAQSSKDDATKLLSNIKSNSNGNFDYKFVNPDQDPQAAIAAGITGDGKILLQMGEHKTIAASATEDEILKGLLRLLNPASSAIYFLTGHGERDIQQSGQSSMTRALSTLESKNYVVKPLNLLVDNKIPDDARVIVIAGPVKPISDDEVKLLKDFLGKGGALIVMEDPTPLTKLGEASDPLENMLAQDWGISFDNDVVIDLRSTEPTFSVSLIPYGSHPITQGMNNIVSVYPFSRSINFSNSKEGLTITPLVTTGPNSWGETDFASLTQGGQVALNDNEKVGPLTLAVAGENTATKGRMVVFGTSAFAVDQMFDTLGNGDMFVNSIDWTAEQENIVSITPKNTTTRSFNPPSQIHWILILLSSIFIIPGLIVLGGVSTWLARRRQG